MGKAWQNKRELERKGVQEKNRHREVKQHGKDKRGVENEKRRGARREGYKGRHRPLFD